MNENISRREALKRMGITLMGAAVSVSGLTALTSCAKEHKKRLILYFTATGNSLFAARQLGDEQISIAQAMKDNNLHFKADEIGMIFPAYRCAPPEIVKRFLDKATLEADYLFAVVTFGNRQCNVVELFDERARKNNHSFDYIATLKMVDNYLPAFDMVEQMKLDKDESGQLSRILADIDSRKRWHEPVSDEDRKFREDFVRERGELFPVASQDLFIVTDACISCGFCAKVCPRGNYSISAESATSEGDCEYCLACIQNCPQRAIQLKAGEKNPNSRYRHPAVSLSDIVRANNQLS